MQINIFRVFKRDFVRVNPEKIDQLKKEWESSQVIMNFQNSLKAQTRGRLADLLDKNLKSFRLDDEIMVRDNIIIEPVRYDYLFIGYNV